MDGDMSKKQEKKKVYSTRERERVYLYVYG